MSNFDDKKEDLTNAYNNGSEEFKQNVDEKLKAMEGTVIGGWLNELFGKPPAE